MQLPKIHQQKIEAMLTRLGLNESERDIYMASRYLGPSTVIQLSQYTDIKRVTAHSNVDKLLQMWLLVDIRHGKKRLIQAASTEALQWLIEAKKFEIEQIESQLQSVTPLFGQIERLAQNFPKVRMFQGMEGINTVLLEMARDGHDVMTMSDAHSMNQLIDTKTLHRSYQKRAQAGVTTQMIFPEGFTDFWHIERDESYDVTIRTLARDYMTQGGVELRWDKIALHSYKEWFVTTTIVENTEIAQLVRMMFWSMWREARDYQGSFVLV